MFGYVVANGDALTSEQKLHYRACYCGLCKSLGQRHGALSKAVLTYDMAFLVLLLSALDEEEPALQKERCLLHPKRPHSYFVNEASGYAADMNVVLAYYNFLDDWQDDRKVLPLCEAQLLKSAFQKTEACYPEKCKVIRKSLDALAAYEQSGELNPDLPAKCFGRLMGEIFAWREDAHADALRLFGEALGIFIYLLDAAIDLKSDLKKERYNPLITMPSHSHREVLHMLMAGCMEKFQALPILKDRELLENILYSGVWTRFEAANKGAKKP